MSDLQKLVDAGAYSCGGDLILKGKSLGFLKNGVFVPNEHGEEMLKREAEVTDVVEKAPKAKAEKAPKAKKVETVDAEPVADKPADDLTGDLTGDLDSLLA